MNDQTALATYIFGAVVVMIISIALRRMVLGWRRRGQRQAQLIGQLPSVPDSLSSATIGPVGGLYVGSTLASDWFERVAAGDLGYRAKAMLTRYPEGILLERSGARSIWIPNDSVTAIRAERGLAGKVIPRPKRSGEQVQGILAIRWTLPSGTEIDTGFRGDDRRDYARWLGEAA